MPPIPRQGASKCTNACNYCRLKKIKCNGGPRCSNCISHDEECIFPPPQRRSRNSFREENKLLVERLSRMEELLQNKNVTQAQPPLQNIVSPSNPVAVQQSPTNTAVPMQTATERSHLPVVHEVIPTPYDETAGFDNIAINIAASPVRSTAGYSFQIPAYISPILSDVEIPTPGDGQSRMTGMIHLGSEKSPGLNDNASARSDKAKCVNSPENPTPEHHGPNSFLAICSDSGRSWVAERTGANDFSQYAQQLTSQISSSLKLQVNRARDRAPDLEAELAWEYCNAYFEEGAEASRGVVDKPAFEARLQAHFEEFPNSDEDPAWYALRNTVYAFGCRLVVSRACNAAAFADAQKQAWRFFENAFAVHTELLYSPTGLLAVEALTAMSYFVEGLGSPALEYMLCSNAARLAQSKGLHLQPSGSWDLDENTTLYRSWLWWTIYCHEKHIASRSGRPSAIDDDDISCQIPTKKPPGSAIDVDFLVACVKHAQILSVVAKSLATAKAYNQTPRELIQTVSRMDSRVEEWRKALPDHFQPTSSIRFTSRSKGIHIQQILYLRFAYYGILIAIHAIFTCPWTATIIRVENSTAFRDQVLTSTEAVAEASRNIILASQHIDVDASSPVWMAFYYPLVALINLFIHVLEYPGSPTANSDVALMDIVAGHFGRVEYLTSSELAFPFIREITTIAHKMVKRGDKIMLQSAGEASTLSHAATIPGGLMDEPMSSFGVGNSNDFSDMELLGSDMESWGVIHPFALGRLNMDFDIPWNDNMPVS